MLFRSRRFEADYKNSLINAYRVLRSTNPSPYMVYMSIDGDEIISTSPDSTEGNCGKSGKYQNRMDGICHHGT